MKTLRPWVGLLLWCVGVASAHAQAWPTRPIRVIVPFSAGSGTDTIARPVLNEMSRLLGQPVVVENRPGAGGTIGMQAVATAEPDGYTLLVHSNSFTVVPSTYTKLAFDPVNDFVGVMPVASLPMALVTSPDKGYRDLKDLIAKAKATPGSITYASAGTGAPRTWGPSVSGWPRASTPCTCRTRAQPKR